MRIRQRIPSSAPPARPERRARVRLETLDDRVVPSFAPMTDYAVGSLPYGLVAADLTGDGNLDLVTANYTGNSVSVLVGNGNGTFQDAQTFAAAPYTHSVVTGDVTGDNKIDVITANNTDVRVLPGTGTGALQAHQTVGLPAQFPPGYTGSTALPQTPTSLAAGDLNGDGKLDLVVGGQTWYSVLVGSGYYGNYYEYHSDGYLNVLIGTGGGAFSVSTYHLDSVPYHMAVADVTGDSRPDVVTDAGGLTTLVGNGNGTLQTPGRTSSGSGFWAVNSSTLPMADFDGDGKLDVVMRDGSGNYVVLMMGNGDGTFRQTPNAWAGGTMQATAVGDINGDGTMDIAVMTTQTTFASYGYYGGYDPTTTEQVKVLLGYGDGTVTLPQTSDLLTTAGYLYTSRSVLGDFDGDGAPDLAAAELYNNMVGVSHNADNWVVPAALRISDATLTEGNSGTANMSFTVTLAHGGSGTVTVNYATASGSAAAGSDFTTTSGALTFTSGQTTQTILVPVIGDVVDEPDQWFAVNLSGAVGADLIDSQGIGTIVDDDPAPTLKIDDVSVIEGNRGTKTLVFTVTLTGQTENWVWVNFATSNGTATTADQDYQSNAGTLYFAPGETTKTISVTIFGDKKREADETFSVNLSGASAATIADGTGIGTILDDDTHGNGNGNNGNGHGHTRRR